MSSANQDTVPDMPDNGARMAQTLSLPFNKPANVEEARVNAQALKDRFALMLGEASGFKVAAEYLKQFQLQNREAGKAWVKILRETFPTFLASLRTAGLKGSLRIEVSEKGQTFDIRRGPDKGKTREWRYASNEGKKKRIKRVRGKAICDTFGVK